MANVEKYGLSDVPKLISHYERGYASKTDPDIDYNRTMLNYNLCPNRGYEYLKKRLENVYIYSGGNGTRKTVYACTWLCTAPKGLPEEETKKFMLITKKFLDSLYGENNCIGAWVNNDEQTPHMHYMFVPVLFDSKHNREKLCASDILTRKHLQTFHDKYQTAIYDGGLNCRVRADQQSDRLKSRDNLSVDKLKARTRERMRDICVEF